MCRKGIGRMELFKYRQGSKKVRIITNDGKEFEGRVTIYDSAMDNPEGVQGIGLDTGFYFWENDIKSIEEIE
ncbi:MAG: hypothetical protein BWY15_00433 [Firmicutes bacterium ADurb.Bin193]|nr:MAG: hypothetical protein BWY15_00433 [Firmicutes bacterium ADurb.Bin193]